jgi:gentisate 1,2-dioxygenase
MLELSDIQSSPEELQEYYAELRAQHITPAWIAGGITAEPRSEAVPFVWHWRDLRPQVMRAAELVGTAQAERRMLRLTNPNCRASRATPWSRTSRSSCRARLPGRTATRERRCA